jgi:GT2 family glycosyltransferase
MLMTAEGLPRPGTFRSRPCVRGKSIHIDGEKLLVRGVTYGGFRPGADGAEFPCPAQVDEDFSAMAAAGVNTVRTYAVPPSWLLDLAREHGLWVMVGLPWEQHVTFLRSQASAARIVERVREAARSCRGHPAVLCYAVGNEIPASIVRWHGHRRIERFLRRLCRAVKQEDPGALVTYVNYPSTEYLYLPFVDLVCFNIFLESDAAFESYLARLQNLAGDRPLLLTELGVDSRRNGERTQARVVERQLRTAFGMGCAGAFVFSWTDEWHRGGCNVLDWDFGLVDRRRRPKPALEAVRRAFARPLSDRPIAPPRASVVVCTYNGECWLRGCLEALSRLDYPDYEVIVVDDGSTDGTAEITREFARFRLISTPNGGLSNARNLGLEAASGAIVAYVDDDARPDESWLTHLVRVLESTGHAAVGGPNIPPPGDGLVADCVANAPGGPIHILLSDTEAEHIPGCNMAFRKASLLEIGGFDPRFRVAGDDVDICWRLHNAGETIGFSPGAVVHHHRRSSVRAYLRQQFQYGKAEALLERKWPRRYNAAGHLTWAGDVYGNCLSTALSRRRGRIHYGTWGRGLFQSVYQRAPGLVSSLPLMPEWLLLIGLLAGVSLLGLLWRPLLLGLPLFGLASGAMLLEAGLAAAHATFKQEPRSLLTTLRRRGLTGLLHLLQPLARLAGRARHGLTPWRRRCPRRLTIPFPRTTSVWSEHWRPPAAWIQLVEAALGRLSPATRRGGDYDRWDLELRGGMLGGVRMRFGFEEHGRGRQFVRCRSWPVPSGAGLVTALAVAGLAGAAASAGATLAGLLLAAATTALLLGAVRDCSAATGTLRSALARQEQEPAAAPAMPRSASHAPHDPQPAIARGMVGVG